MTLGQVCIAVDNKDVSAMQLVMSYVNAMQDICDTVHAGPVSPVR